MAAIPDAVWIFLIVTWVGGIGTTISAILWLMKKFADQDEKREVLKVDVLREFRDTRHTLRGRFDQQDEILREKMGEKFEDIQRQLHTLALSQGRIEAKINGTG